MFRFSIIILRINYQGEEIYIRPRVNWFSSLEPPFLDVLVRKASETQRAETRNPEGSHYQAGIYFVAQRSSSII